MPPQQIYHTIYLWFLSMRDLSIITNFCVLQKENIDILYNIPYCVFEKFCYDRSTKR